MTSWSDDPEVAARVHASRIRGGLIRSAIIWTPLFAIVFAGLLFALADVLFDLGHDSTWFFVVVLLVISGLFGFQASQALLDLRAKPRDLEGEVTRRWSRTDSFVMRSHYIRVGDRILRGDVFVLAGVEEGDRVRLRYYPNSALIAALDKVPQEPEPEPADPNRP